MLAECCVGGARGRELPALDAGRALRVRRANSGTLSARHLRDQPERRHQRRQDDGAAACRIGLVLARITDGGLLRSMRSTENAVEVLAQASHGTVLALDEMAHADGKAIGRTIYSLAGNVGKGRMRADATMRRSYSWSTFAILSGETSLEEKVRGDGGHWTGGMAVRFADVDLTGVNRAVAVDQLDRLRRISSITGMPARRSCAGCSKAVCSTRRKP